jgi:hypothetical protein
MIKVEIKNKISLPRFEFTKDLEYIAEKIFIPYMQDGITSGKDLYGDNFPPNSKATIKKKGHDRVLVETGQLRSSFKTKTLKNSVKINLKSNRSDIGYSLQVEGVKSRSGMQYYNFFGINNYMEKIAMNYMNDKVRKQLNAS